MRLPLDCDPVLSDESGGSMGTHLEIQTTKPVQQRVPSKFGFANFNALASMNGRLETGPEPSQILNSSYFSFIKRLNTFTKSEEYFPMTGIVYLK